MLFVCVKSAVITLEGKQQISCCCLLCFKDIRICKTLESSNEPYIDVDKVRKHLNKCHAGLAEAIESRYASVRSLISPIVINNKEVVQPVINSFFNERSISAHSQITPAKAVEDDSWEESDSWTNISKTLALSCFRLIRGNISLTWDQRNGFFEETLDHSFDKEIWGDVLPSYRQSVRGISAIYENTKIRIKEYVRKLDYYALSCDGYSIPTKNIKTIVVFLHEYTNMKYRSLLLDVRSIASNKDIKEVVAQVIKEFDLKRIPLRITTDCANSMTYAFGENQIGCYCHRINTTCRHLVNTSTNAGARGVKYGLNANERQTVKRFFDSINETLKTVRGNVFKEFCFFYGDYSSSLHMSAKQPCKPPKESPTRWLGIIPQIRWLLDYGVMLYYFASINKDILNPVDLRKLLDTLPLVAKLLFALEKVMDLIMVESKPTIHLVVPALKALEKYLLTQRFTEKSIPDLICRGILFELQYGCLQVAQDDFCYVAMSLYPHIEHIVSRDIVLLADTAAKRLFDEVLHDNGEYYLAFIKLLRLRDNSSKGMGNMYSFIIPRDIHLKGDLSKVDSLVAEENGVAQQVKEVDQMIEKVKKKLEGKMKDTNTTVKRKRGRPAETVESLTTKLQKLEADRKTLQDKIKKDQNQAVEKQDSNEEWKNLDKLYDFSPIPESCSKDQDNDTVILEMLSRILCIPASEAVCERFFRHMSIVLKKPYVTNMSDERACQLAYIRYNFKYCYMLHTKGDSKHLLESEIS